MSGYTAPVIPIPSTSTPNTESTVGSAGTDPSKYAMEGHQHPRLTSTTYAVLAADGTASVLFTRGFVNKPGFSITEIDATASQPLTCVVSSFIQSNGLYTGCVIKGYRAQTLPAVIGLVSSLINYNIFAGLAGGASVSVVAIARSDVPQ